jgi:predicted TIM-barrel fold metal-dependent hydrolase
MPDLPKWDVHHHIVPDFYVEEMRRQGVTEVTSLQWPKWSPRSSLRAMDKFNIEKAFLSVSAPGIFVDDAAAARSLSRRCNEFMATMASDHSGRYGAFAVLPLPDVDAAIEETRFALDVLKIDGLSMLSNVAGIHLGDARLRELFAELDRREATVYVHPNGADHRADHRLLNLLYWWQNDTTRSIVEFVAAGYHKDYPNIRWIFAHGGGVLPVAYRAIVRALASSNPDVEAELLQWQQNVFVDTASKAYDEQIPALVGLSGPGHVLFGSDLGWAPRSAVSTLIKSWNAAETKFGLGTAELAAIYRGNAQRLFSHQPAPVTATPKVVLSHENSHGVYERHCLPQATADQLHSLHPGVDLSGLDIWDEERERALAQNRRAMLSLHIPALWQLPPHHVAPILHTYNQEVAGIGSRNPEMFSVFGAIDIRDPERAAGEIDHCLDTLALDGICLSTRICDAPFTDLLDERLCRKLAERRAVVMIHPQDATGLPLANENYLDSVAFMAKAFYLEAYRRELHQVRFVLTHTCETLPYLAEPLNILYYMTAHRRRIAPFVLDNFITHRPKGYRALMNTTATVELCP